MSQELRPNTGDSGVVYYSKTEGIRSLTPLFQGQGTQEVGMGRDLSERYNRVRKLYRLAEDVLGYSLLDLSEEQLNRTEFAQPAIFVHNEACRTILTGGLIKRRRIKPMFYAGNSLGEYNAFLAAGAFSFEDGLSLVQARGRGMQIANDENPGGLLALLIDTRRNSQPTGIQLGYFATTVVSLTEELGLYCEAENSDTQIILGGRNKDIQKAQEWFQKSGHSEKGLMLMKLRAAGAFHSPLMIPAIPILKEALNNTPLKKPETPVIANTTAKPVTKPEEIKFELINHLTMPVRWKDTINFLEEAGVAATLEVGKKSILTKMMGQKGIIATGSLGLAVGIATLLYFRREAQKNN